MKQAELSSKWQLVATIGMVVLITLLVQLLALEKNNFSVTPDISGLACAADRLNATGQLNTYAVPPTVYEMCWKNTTYPALQYIHAFALRILPIEPISLVLITGLLAVVAATMLVSIWTWQISRNPWVAGLAGTLAAFTPALLRSMILTPQNTIGYAGILLLLVCFTAFLQQLSKWRYLWLVGSVIVLLCLYFVHTLSFGIAAALFVFIVWACVIQPWWLQLVLLVSGVGIFFAQIQFMFIPDALWSRVSYFLSSQIAGFYHPVWDHPAIWGYIITALAAAGIAFAKIEWRTRVMLSMCIMAALVFGHLPAFGIGLLPNRFIPFAWLGLVPAAALGVQVLFTQLRWPNWLKYSWLGLILVAQAAHGYVFMLDDLNGLSYRYVPRPGFTEALTWLDAYDPAATLLGVQSAENQEILLAPLWYSGNTIYYPWYALNHRKLKEFSVINPGSPYYEILQQPENPIYMRLYDLYAIVTGPDVSTTPNNIANQLIDYFIIPKKSKVYTEVWGKSDFGEQRKIYESDYYIIYQLQ